MRNFVRVMRFFWCQNGFLATVCDRFFPGSLSIMESTRGGRGVVIYGDILFVWNAVIDYLLLLVSARAAGAPLRRRRFALGSLL